MERIENRIFDEERALYESSGVQVVNCRFEGPADGESAMKESRDLEVKDCFFGFILCINICKNLFLTHSLRLSSGT